jgi:glycine betaine/proline transport system substrate-binding protein
MKPVKRLLFLAIALILLAAACNGGGAEPAADTPEPEAAPVTETDEGEEAAEPAAEEEAAAEGERPLVKLVTNPWSASELNVAVAGILLEEELGYPVEVVSLDENAQWTALASGDVHASLEVWPSGHVANVEQYIDDLGVVEHGGPLGPIGKIGWYVPSYVVEAQPELATWEGFLGEEAAALFATAETGDQGQFIGGDPSFVQYDQDIIDNLGMDFEVVYAGSEEAILSQLDAAYSREEPVLFYFWTPHSVHAQYELTEVELPAYSDECYAEADAGSVECDYPADELYKIFWADFDEYAPEAHQLLTNMNYTTEDQIGMIAAVELEGQSVEEAAREWLEANESTWQSWLP